MNTAFKFQLWKIASDCLQSLVPGRKPNEIHRSYVTYYFSKCIEYFNYSLFWKSYNKWNVHFDYGTPPKKLSMIKWIKIRYYAYTIFCWRKLETILTQCCKIWWVVWMVRERDTIPQILASSSNRVLPLMFFDSKNCLWLVALTLAFFIRLLMWLSPLFIGQCNCFILKATQIGFVCVTFAFFGLEWTILVLS